MDRAYLVCSTPRSGSTLLCHTLAATGVAGNPTEYFNPRTRAELTARWGCEPSLASYMQALRSERTSSNGVLGSKLHWDQFEKLRAEALGTPPGEPGYEVDADFLDELFPDLRYVHIARRDVNRQAVSLWIASRTNEWHRETGAPTPTAAAPYSFDGIVRWRRYLANAELHWDRFFRFNGIVPVSVVYEELVADCAGTVARVIAEICPEEQGVAVPEPHIARQADERSDELLERFLRDLETRSAHGPAPSIPLPTRVATRLRSMARSLP